MIQNSTELLLSTVTRRIAGLIFGDMVLAKIEQPIDNVAKTIYNINILDKTG